MCIFIVVVIEHVKHNVYKVNCADNDKIHKDVPLNQFFFKTLRKHGINASEIQMALCMIADYCLPSSRFSEIFNKVSYYEPL